MNDPRQEWSTPSDFWKAIAREYGPTIDVCARANNAKCLEFISPEEDALAEGTSWLSAKHRVAWCNPGFSNPRPWIEKAISEIVRFNSRDATVLVLGLVSPSAEWWRIAEQAALEILLIGGRRIQFDPAEGVTRSSNARENALFVFRRRMRPSTIYTWYWADEG